MNNEQKLIQLRNEVESIVVMTPDVSKFNQRLFEILAIHKKMIDVYRVCKGTEEIKMASSLISQTERHAILFAEKHIDEHVNFIYFLCNNNWE